MLVLYSSIIEEKGNRNIESAAYRNTKEDCFLYFITLELLISSLSVAVRFPREAFIR